MSGLMLSFRRGVSDVIAAVLFDVGLIDLQAVALFIPGE